jgi:hypothetical protein
VASAPRRRHQTVGDGIAGGECERDAALHQDCCGIAGPLTARVLEAAAKLALIGAIAEASERFEWQDVVDCANFCREAIANPTVSGLR